MSVDAVRSRSPLRVVVVDDHALVRQGLRGLLESAGFSIVGEAGTAAEALEVVTEARPDVMLLDLRLGEDDGLATARACKESVSGCKVLVLSAQGDGEQLRAALAAGADGYLLKGVTATELVEGLRRIIAGETVIDRAFMPTLVAGFAERGEEEPLSVREHEVLALATEGLTAKAIARRLGISVRTVQKHFENMHRKLGVASRAELISEAFRRSLLR